MVEETAANSSLEQPVPPSYAFAKYLPRLAAAMDDFVEITGIREFGGGVDHRGLSCWPLNLPMPCGAPDERKSADTENPQSGLSKNNYIRFKDKVRNSFRPLFYDELVDLVPEWRRLSEVKNNSVELHSYLVLYLTWTDNRLDAYSQKQIETLKWAALLHDISKRGQPEFMGRDHTHPFAGGLQVLKIFRRLGFLEADLEGAALNEESFDRVCSLIESSIHAPVDPNYGMRFKEGEKFCTEVHSHEHLDEIFDLLWNGGVLKRGTFSDHVFRLVFFHQSLCGLADHPPMVKTSEQERKLLCDPEFLQLVLVLMSNDSASYTFLKDVALMKNFDGQFHNSHKMMMEEQQVCCSDTQIAHADTDNTL